MRCVHSGMIKLSIKQYGLFVLFLMIAGCGSDTGSSEHSASDKGSALLFLPVISVNPCNCSD